MNSIAPVVAARTSPLRPAGPSPFTSPDVREARRAFDARALKPTQVAMPVPASVSRELASTVIGVSSSVQAVEANGKRYWQVTHDYRSGQGTGHVLFTADGKQLFLGRDYKNAHGVRWTSASDSERSAGNRVMGALHQHFKSEQHDRHFVPKTPGLEIPVSALPKLEQEDRFGHEFGKPGKAFKFTVDGRDYFLVFQEGHTERSRGRPAVFNAKGQQVLTHVYSSMQVNEERFRD